MIQSLRLRLVCAAAVAVVIVSAAAVVMAPFEIRDTGLALPRLLEEPYQDLLLLVPLRRPSGEHARWCQPGHGLQSKSSPPTIPPYVSARMHPAAC